LSQQLRRFLDDRAFLENRRILELLRGIESKALALREAPPTGTVMYIDAMGADIQLPLERPLFSPSVMPRLAEMALIAGEDDIDAARLFEQIVVDKARLRRAVQRALRQKAQVTLRELLEAEPLKQGLAELVAYLELAHAGDGSNSVAGLRAVVDEAVIEPIRWQARCATGEAVMREARLPRIIFTR
jgi:hypothetical protein